MRYLGEFVRHWPNLLGAALGLAFGSALNHYMLNLFGPVLLEEFGWSRSQFALVGTLGLVSIAFMPLAGWVADHFGARIAAMIGFTTVPLSYVLFAMMTGPIWQFYAILVFMHSLGILTTTMVFTRVVVERFDRARGFALACLLSCPPLVGAVMAPLIARLIETEGWRSAYLALAMATAIGGIAAIALVGPARHGTGAAHRQPGPRLAELRSLCGNRMFVLLAAGMFLVNFPQVLVSSQLSIMLMENGASAAFAASLLSVYAIAVVVGRFVSGFALDRISPHLVALFSLGLPALGYVGLSSEYDMRWMLGLAMALIGLAQGAETDLAAILTSRNFDNRRYSLVFSLLMMAMGISSIIGSAVLSVTLRGGGRFDLFLLICAVATALGAACFYLTGRRSTVAQFT